MKTPDGVKRGEPRQDPAVFAVVAAEQVFHFERLAGAERRGVTAEVKVAVVGVNVVGPAVAEFPSQAAGR